MGEITEKLNKDNAEYNFKVNQYLEYLHNHIETVNKVFNLLKLYLTDYNVWEILKMKEIVCKHDIDKYTPTMFDAYRQWFYPTCIECPDKKKMDEAFELHILNNPHHWQYWQQSEIPTNIKANKDYYLIEMVCDWIAMGILFKNTATEYYNKNKDSIKLMSEDKIIIEHLLTYEDDILNSYCKNSTK